MIGSNTKAFTATALCLLEHEKKFSIDDKIKKWIPNFRLYDTLASERATIRDMLCHRSGLKTFQGDFTYWTSDLTRQQVIETFGKIKPAYDFRSRYGYCNAGFVTAGEVIPAATGQSWEQVIRERILAPLKMTRTLALSAELPTAENRATAHKVLQGKSTIIPYCQIDNLAAAGSMSSSIREMATWLQMQLDTGKFEGRQIFPKEVIQKTWEGNLVISTYKPSLIPRHYSLYGLGWFLQDYAGRQLIQHSGGVNGFLSQTFFLPEERLACVVLTNSSGGQSLYQALMYQILDAYLAQPYKNYSQIFWQYYRESQQDLAEQQRKNQALIAKKVKPALPLAAYAGHYQNEVYGNIEVKLEKGKLNVYFSHHPRLIGKLDPLGANDFLCTYSDAEYGVHPTPFTVKDGQASTISIKVSDGLELDPYLFVRK
jgi:CubicO group peptidase (beta-lactamase class C family)